MAKEHRKNDMSANDARNADSSRSRRQARLLGWSRWTTGALLSLIIAMPIVTSAQDRQLQLVSTAWSPFTNGPGQPRFALDLAE